MHQKKIFRCVFEEGEIMKQSVCERIKELRASTGETQQQLADAIGTKRENIKCWEDGTRRIKDFDIVKLAEHFGVTCDYVLGRSVPAASNDIESMVCQHSNLTPAAVRKLRRELAYHAETVNKILESEVFISLVFRLDQMKVLAESNADTEKINETRLLAELDTRSIVDAAESSALASNGMHREGSQIIKE